MAIVDPFKPEAAAASPGIVDPFKPTLTRPSSSASAAFDASRASAPAPQLTRSWGEAAGDVGRAVMSGAAGLVKTGGELYGLATGDMDNTATELANNAQEYWQSGQSASLKRDQAARKEAIDAAPTTLGKIKEAVVQTLKRPSLIADTAAENIMTMLPAGAAGRGGKVLAGVLGAGEKAAARVGVGAAVGAAGVQQGADVSQQAYDSALADTDWASNPDFQKRVAAGEAPAAVQHDIALKAARLTFPGATAVSLASQALPGGATLERALVGGAARNVLTRPGVTGVLAGAVKGVLGEGTQEAVEEGGGQAFGNLVRQQTVDPNTDLTQDVGENAGIGFVGGALLGGPAGAVHGSAGHGDAHAPAPQGPLTRAAAKAPSVPFPDAQPGSLSDAANLIRPGAAAFVGDAQGNVQDVRHPNAAAPAPAAEATPPASAAPTQEPQAAVAANGASYIEQPDGSYVPAPPAVPWFDQATGEMRQPTSDEIKDQFHRMFDMARAEGLSMQATAASKSLSDEWGIPRGRLIVLRKEALEERNAGITPETRPAAAEPSQENADAPAESPGVAPQPSAEDVAGEAPVQPPAAQPAEAGATPSEEPAQHATPDEVRSEPAPETQNAGIAQGADAVPGPASDGDALAGTAAGTAAAAGEAPLSERARGTDAVDAHDGTARSAEDVADGNASPAPVAASYDESPEQQDSDVTTPSGSPFTIRNAAEVAAKRHEGGKVFAVDGGYVVRTPKSDTGIPVSEQKQAPAAIDAHAAPMAPAVDAASREAAMHPASPHAEPTDAQKEAGNYKKGHVNLHGLDVSIENPAGTARRPEWPPLKHAYGYIKRTEGGDGEHVDVFMGQHAEDASKPVFVIDQVDPKSRKFDEHKVMLGFASGKDARAAYQANYAKGWKGFGAIKRMSVDEFKAWVRSDAAKKPAAEVPNERPAERQPGVEPVRPAGEVAPAGADVSSEAGKPDAPVAATGIDERIAKAEADGVVLSEKDKAAIRDAHARAEAARRTAARAMGASSDPLNKGNAFPLGVGFTRMTRRKKQALDRSVMKAGDAVKAFKQTDTFGRARDQLLAGKGTEADVAAKAKRKHDSAVATLRKLLNGELKTIGQYKVERVTKDKQGYPAAVMVSGEGIVKGVDDRLDLARSLFDGSKERLRAAVDEARATPAESISEASPAASAVADDASHAQFDLSNRDTFPTVRDAQHYDAIDSAVRAAIAEWGQNAPPVFVVPTVEELPTAAKSSQGYDYRRAAGFYNGKSVWIVADKHATPKAALVALTHEAIGHHGIDRIIDDYAPGGWKRMSADVDRLRQDRALGSKALRDVLDTVERKYQRKDGTPATPETFAKEFIAIAAERNLRNGLVARVLAAVRQWLRATFPNTWAQMKFGEADVLRMIAASDAFIRSGPARAELGAQLAAASFQVAYHGTPHVVDHFSMQKIGTGEGNQTYGYGLYFASAKDVADHYRGGLGKATERTAEVRPAAVAALKRHDNLGFDSVGEALSAIRTHPDFAQRWEFETPADVAAARAYRESFGNLYKVEVPEDSELLDWDKPLAEQPAKVRAGIEQVIASGALDAGALREWNAASPASQTGKRFYTVLQQSDAIDGPPGASHALFAAGIPGLRYLDGQSRGNGAGSHNYVIWDEGSISDVQSAFSLAPATDTPAFKRYFDGSKVVDAKGAPQVVYHGTGEEFTEFKSQFAGASTEHSTTPLGHFFTTSKQLAQRYAEKAADGRPADERIVSGYLAIKNPYDMSVDEAHGIDDPADARKLRAKLEREGYDGIRIKEAGTWIAFESGQVKSVDNRGTFDRANPDINFSLDDNAEPFQKPTASIESLNEAMSAPDGSTFERAKAWLRGKAEDFRPAALGALQRRHLTELMDDHTALHGYGKQYDERVQRLEADRTQLMAGAPDAAEHPNDMLKRGGAKIADDLRKFTFVKGPAGWLGRRNPESDRLARVMHEATLQGLDPSEEYTKLMMEDSKGELLAWTPQALKERIKAIKGQIRGRAGDDKRAMMDEIKNLRSLPARERAREAAWPGMLAAYQQLSPEAKALYKQTRDWYSQIRDETEKGLIGRIEALGREMAGTQGEDLAKRYVRQAVQRIRLQFEMNRLEGVYFPLNRDGDFWVSFSDKDGAQGFKMFESAADAASAEKKLRAAGFRIEAQGRRDSEFRAKSAPSGTFIGEVIKILKESGAPEKVQDEVYQTFLRTLPEMSMRKHSIHRKKVPGFSEDALRAFAKNAFHGSHQLARLRHAHELGAIVEGAQTSMDNFRRAGELGDSSESAALDVARGDALLAELKKRHDYMMSPKDAQLANVANSIGFIYYLGASPASALVNLTQNAQVTLPVLGAQFGWGKASRVMAAALRDSLRTFGNMDRTLTSQEERVAYNTLRQRGDIDKTQSHTLAGLAEGNTLQTNPVWARAMTGLSFMFHRAEIINREAAGMAAYRLARAGGGTGKFAKPMTMQEAVQFASDTINGTHFDYSAANRPRIMQGNAARVALQFKNYSVGMTWTLYRNLYQAFKGESPEVRSVARKTLTGVLGMTALMAGTMGLPIINAVKYAAMAAHGLFGDDDEPWSFDTEFRQWLADNLGEDAAKWVADGVVNRTGINLAHRVSLSNLWFQDADRELEGKDAYYQLLESIAGPIGGIAKNLFVGTQMIGDGNVERGVETMMPKFAKDAMKATRFAHDGANTLRGDPILPDVSSPQAFIQALGFQPTALFEQQKTNSALKSYEQDILDRRQTLMNAYAMAVRQGADADAAMAKIHSYNARFPEIAIKSESLRQSLRARARYSAEQQGGVAINKKLRPRLQEMVGVSSSP